MEKLSSQLDWQKERPKEPCVFMTRWWEYEIKIYRYDIWRLEYIDNGDGEYLAWLTEDGIEYDDINTCNFDEYYIIESKLVADLCEDCFARNQKQIPVIVLAEQFHKLYEELAPKFGYETRKDTKIFNPESNNGKLMIAVSEQILKWLFH